MNSFHFSISISLAIALAAPIASAEPATITEASNTVSKGTITVDASPADVYALITDYASWRKFLTDLTSVKVLSGGRRDARVKMESRALEHEVTIAFDNEVDRATRFKLVDGPSGARASGEYLLVATDSGKRTRIDATLYMDVVGVAGMFVGDKKIRTMRQGKLRADLDDIARWLRLQSRRTETP